MTSLKEGVSIVAIVPIRGSDPEFSGGAMPNLGDRPLLNYTFEAMKEARLLSRRVVSTDSERIAAAARAAGLDVPFIRPSSLSGSKASVTDVLLHTIEWLQREESFSVDWVVKLEITHPFRPQGLIDLLIKTTLASHVDSSFLAQEQVSSFWTLDEENHPRPVNQEVGLPRNSRRPFYKDMSGLGAMTRVSNLKAGELYGPNLALIPIRDNFAAVDTHEGWQNDTQDFRGSQLAELLSSSYLKNRLSESSRA